MQSGRILWVAASITVKIEKEGNLNCLPATRSEGVIGAVSGSASRMSHFLIRWKIFLD
jgi:hypothetical protein